MTRCQKGKKVFVGPNFLKKEVWGVGVIPVFPQCLLGFGYQGKDIIV
jgi:hypothetical protein